jgi:hypothetical protein
MTYKLLTEVGHHYANEDIPDDPLLRGLSAQLKTSLSLLKQSTTAPAAAETVKGLAGQFEQRARMQNAHVYREQVVRTRHKLHMLGLVADDNGNVTWPASRSFVRYDYSLEKQGLTRMDFVGGRLKARNGNFVDTAGFGTVQAGAGAAIYVMSAEGHFHYAGMEVDKLHHSSLLAGIPVAGAGEFKATNGRITFLSNDSGHYDPNIKHFLQVLHEIQKHAPLNFAINYVYLDAYNNVRDAAYPSVAEFMEDNELDDESYDLHNLLDAYRHLLTRPNLDSQGWEFRDQPRVGVYSMSTGEQVSHHEVRHYFKGKGQPAMQSGMGR